MADDCCNAVPVGTRNAVPPHYRRALWIALIVNVIMFGVEAAAGWRADSVSLLADAVDFFGDAANYGISLFVLSLAAVWRSRSALLKGLSMGAFGISVLGKTAWAIWHGVLPDAATMGVVGFIALLANVGVAALLYAYRNGDADMRSVWLCTRNDAIGNVAVILAALGVFGIGSAWPDLAVAVVMSLLSLTAAVSVLRQVSAELRAGRSTSLRDANRFGA